MTDTSLGAAVVLSLAKTAPEVVVITSDSDVELQCPMARGIARGGRILCLAALAALLLRSAHIPQALNEVDVLTHSSNGADASSGSSQQVMRRWISWRMSQTHSALQF